MPHNVEDVLILAGGFGTRLGKLTEKCPKPLLEVNGLPFIFYIIKSVVEKNKNIKRIYISVGFLSELFIDIKNVFEINFKKIKFLFIEENQPLGTGGAVKLGLSRIKKPTIVLNGDTFFPFNFQSFNFEKSSSPVIAVKREKKVNCSRYGAISIVDGRVIDFGNNSKSSLIFFNAGTYFFPDYQIFIDMPDSFSLEEFFQVYVKKNEILGIEINAPFIDIGVPEDFKKAKSFLEEINLNMEIN